MYDFLQKSVKQSLTPLLDKDLNDIVDAGLHISVIDTRSDILNIYDKYIVVSATIFLLQYIYKELSFRRYSQCSVVKCL